MRNLLKYMILGLSLIDVICIGAQSAGDSIQTASRIQKGKIDPFWFTVTYNKTTHLIFPSSIKYVDLGSDHIVAGKVERAENVLRVKAAIRNFESETNFSVVTEDGRFYNFDVLYSDYPASLNYDLSKVQYAEQFTNYKQVEFTDLHSAEPSLVDLYMKEICRRDKSVIRHVVSRKFGIGFQLKGVYTDGRQYYFHTEIDNRSNVAFDIDFVVFKIIDKKLAKRTVVQEDQVEVIRKYRRDETAMADGRLQNVYVTDQFTTADDKVLVIEIYEKNGGRHQVLQVDNRDLIRAKQLDQERLRIKDYN